MIVQQDEFVRLANFKINCSKVQLMPLRKIFCADNHNTKLKAIKIRGSAIVSQTKFDFPI